MLEGWDCSRAWSSESCVATMFLQLFLGSLALVLIKIIMHPVTAAESLHYTKQLLLQCNQGLLSCIFVM